MSTDFQPENPLTFRVLYESPLIRVQDYCCCAGRGVPAAEEYSPLHQIVLMRQGVFCKHIGRQMVTADVNRAIFFPQGSSYRISHPADYGDRGTVFVPAPHLLQDIIREFDPSVDDHRNDPFPSLTGPSDARVFWQHRKLIQCLEANALETQEPIWMETTALQIIAEVLNAAFRARDIPQKHRRAGTQAEHADQAEAVKSYLASRLSERITLSEIAQAVCVSPFHLARVFHQQAGIPIHRYLTQLRLRASLERLGDTPDDLTTLALDLGFSSQSHFTDAFRREFGQPPSQIRRKMRKNLEV